jgi:DNA polymerase-3 subunit beta
MLISTAVVQICLDNSRIIFDMGDITLVSRLIEGEYPDYERVIPVDNGIKLTMDTERLLSVLRRIGTMVNHNLPGAKMEAIGDTLKVSSSTPEYGEANEEMLIKKEGEDIAVGLNVRYLMDVLKATDDESVIMEMSDPLKPIILRPAINNGHLSVIMPMHI